MAFNNRKFNRLIEEEKLQREQSAAVDFEDDFDDDLGDIEPEVEQPIEFEPVEELVTEEEVYEEPVAPQPVTQPVPEQPEQTESFDAMKLWMELTNLAVEAKKRIAAGAFFKANDVVSAMRTVLVEFICHGSNIAVEDADSLSDSEKENIYKTYPKAFNEAELTETVNFMMSLALKYL